jgi:flagellar biosynthesis protein FlhF
MRIKKYQAKDMPEALALIRADLGRDAVILHSEEVRGRGPLARLRRPYLEVVAAVDTDLSDFPRPTPAADQSIQRMQSELAALKLALAQVTETRLEPGNGARSVASLEDWYRRLLEQGVAVPLAQQVIQTVADELSRWALDNQSVLNEHLHWHLGRRLTIAEPLSVTPGRSTVFFLVGPTGVGKTATIAKLSANFSRAQRARVMIITTDTFRVGAISQITAFGQILGIPVEVAYSPPQLAALVTGNRRYDLILVDTPGRNQRVADQVTDLSHYVAAVPRRVVHLALAAGAKYEDMRQTAQVFGSVSLNGLLFTKLDETSTLGPAYTLACETGLPLSYLTTGVRVPEDIEVATAERLVESMVGRVPDDVLRGNRRNGRHARRAATLRLEEVQ